MKKILVVFSGFIAAGLPALAGASLYTLSNLFVFGDSLSDGGNSGLLTYTATGGAIAFPPPPYYQGDPAYTNRSRYSNGPVAVEYLWDRYHPGGTSFQPSLAGGTNYAIGGATTGTANFNSVNSGVPAALQPVFENRGTAWQLNQFATNPVAFNPSTSLFTVWLFPNDLFYAGQTGQLPGQLYPPPVQPDVISNGIANIVTLIQWLAAAGAEHFLVPNMPDLSDTPEFYGDATMSYLSQQFNTYLALALTALDTALIDAEIVQFDTSAALKTLIANPSAYGLTNTTGACVYNPGSCDPTANTWLFWDGVHPTTRVHDILASMMYNAVPEPMSLLLLVFGLFGIMVWRRGPLAGGFAARYAYSPTYCAIQPPSTGMPTPRTLAAAAEHR